MICSIWNASRSCLWVHLSTCKRLTHKKMPALQQIWSRARVLGSQIQIRIDFVLKHNFAGWRGRIHTRFHCAQATRLGAFKWHEGFRLVVDKWYGIGRPNEGIPSPTAHSTKPELKLQELLKNLKPHQRVNHLPSSASYANKVVYKRTSWRQSFLQGLLAQLSIHGIPIAFAYPRDKKQLETVAKTHPEMKWVFNWLHVFTS